MAVVYLAPVASHPGDDGNRSMLRRGQPDAPSCTFRPEWLKHFKPQRHYNCLTHRELLPYNKEFGPTRISL